MVLNDEYLAEVAARLEAATSGPWKSLVEGRDHTSGSNFIRTASDDIELIGGSIADQDFVAYARQDVEVLLAEVRRLRSLKSE